MIAKNDPPLEYLNNLKKYLENNKNKSFINYNNLLGTQIEKIVDIDNESDYFDELFIEINPLSFSRFSGRKIYS